MLERAHGSDAATGSAVAAVIVGSWLAPVDPCAAAVCVCVCAGAAVSWDGFPHVLNVSELLGNLHRGDLKVPVHVCNLFSNRINAAAIRVLANDAIYAFVNIASLRVDLAADGPGTSFTTSRKNTT